MMKGDKKNNDCLCRKSLAIINQSHSCKKQFYSVEEMSKTLLFNTTDDLAKATLHYGLQISNGGVIFAKGKFNWEALLVRDVFTVILSY